MYIVFYFVPAIVIFIVSLIILIYCKYRCIRESGREAAPPDQAVVPAFVVPAGVPEWVTTPRLLCMHYYFSSQFTLVRETAQRYFHRPQLAGSTETVELGVFQLRVFNVFYLIWCLFVSVCLSVCLYHCMCDRLLVCMYSVCLCNCVILALFPNVVEIFCYLNKENNLKFFFQIVLKYLLVFFLLICNKLVIFL